MDSYASLVNLNPSEHPVFHRFYRSPADPTRSSLRSRRGVLTTATTDPCGEKPKLIYLPLGAIAAAFSMCATQK